MKKAVLHWQLNEQPEAAGTERYCHNCGRKVLFQDSGKRRHNANGKNIYEYAIFKCEGGHTWNQILTIQKAAETVRNMNLEIGKEFIAQDEPARLPELPDQPGMAENPAEKYENDLINIIELKKNGICAAEIILDFVSGKWRLDKALSRQIPELSRAQLEKQIKDGTIRLDGEIVKPGSLLKPMQVITISFIGT